MENKFSKFINKVKIARGKRWSDLEAFTPTISTFMWPTHIKIDKQIEVYMKVPEEVEHMTFAADEDAKEARQLSYILCIFFS